MRKVTLFLMLFVALQVSAQQFHFMPKVGLNLANMTNSGASMRAGMNIGVSGEIMISPKFAIEPGIYYSMQGCKESPLTLKMDYLNIPIYAKYYIYDGFNVFAGPQFGFNVSTKGNISSGGVSANVDMKKAFNTVDCALGIGLGYQFDLGLLVSLNYNIGLTNLLKDGKWDFGGEVVDWDGEKSHNGVFQLNVGWRF